MQVPVPPGYCPYRVESIQTLLCLLDATRPTLRSLSLISPDLTADEARALCRLVGAHLHFLALFLVDVTIHQSADAQLLLGLAGPPSGRHPYHGDRPLDGTADAEDEAEAEQCEYEEMQTEMVRNAADGLCVALQEPARVLCHDPRRAPPQVTLAACRAALAEPRWLR